MSKKKKFKISKENIFGLNKRQVPEVPETSEETKSQIQQMNENLGKMVDLLAAKTEAEATEAKADTVEGKETETETVEVKEPDAVEETVEPETVEPEIAEPEIVEPEIVESEIVEPEPEPAPQPEPESTPEPEPESEQPTPEPTPEPEQPTPEPEPEPTPEPESTPEPEPEPEQPTPEPEDRLGDLAHNFDNTGQLPKELEDYILEYYIFKTIDRNPDLLVGLFDKHSDKFLDKFFDEYFDKYLARNISEIPRIDEAIRRVADKNVEIGLKYVHIRTNEQYSSWDEAVESMREVTEVYDLKPEDFFRKKYFRFDQPDKEITEDEVRKYISSFRGDRKKLYKKLQIEPKKQN